MNAAPARTGHAFAQAVYKVVRQIPRGQVASYGQVGTYLGSPRLARAVGNALRALGPADKDVPWQRVIRADGTVATRGDHRRAPRQVRLLRAEGVAVDNDWRVPMEIYGWAGPRKSRSARVDFAPPPPLQNTRPPRRKPRTRAQRRRNHPALMCYGPWLFRSPLRSF